MTLTLAQYRTNILKKLDDATSARYSSDQIDEGIRSALSDFSTYRPIERTYTIDTTGLRDIELPADFTAVYITKVQLWNANPNLTKEINFLAWMEDESWFIRTPDAIYPAGYTLTITYTAPHTINSLDGAAGTTIDDDNLLCTGAAGYAAQQRAVSRAETINMQPEVQAKLFQMGSYYLQQFMGRIMKPRQVISKDFTFPEP